MLTILQGDCLEVLKTLPAESVHCCITSPPYWGLRDYGIPPTVWGGDPECEHEWQERRYYTEKSAGKASADACHTPGPDNAARLKEARWRTDCTCTKCGAWLGNFGLEPTPEMYVEHSVMIFREVRRVLRKDGTLWVNLGDSFHTGNSGFGRQGTINSQRVGRTHTQPNLKSGLIIEGRKPGDLVGIPWLVAFALQRDGWYLRRDNIWHKPNPMPESVNGWRWERHRVKVAAGAVSRHGTAGVQEPHGDSISDRAGAQFEDCPGCAKCSPHGGRILRKGAWRCTTAHEYVFQFSSSADYFCDAEAAKERCSTKASGNKARKFRIDHGGNPALPNSHQGFSGPWKATSAGRNRRSVWRVTTKPYKEAHFATFPPELIRPIVQSAAPRMCCEKCGAPHVPVVERARSFESNQSRAGNGISGGKHGDRKQGGGETGDVRRGPVVHTQTIQHLPSCRCKAGSTEATVLDPFGGSGTTGQVALELGRRAILIELNADYIPLIHKRTTITRGLGL